MGDTSGTIEKVTRKEIAMELFRRSWVLKTYVSQLEAENAKIQAENDGLLLAVFELIQDIRAKSDCEYCRRGPRWESVDTGG